MQEHVVFPMDRTFEALFQNLGGSVTSAEHWQDKVHWNRTDPFEWKSLALALSNTIAALDWQWRKSQMLNSPIASDTQETSNQSPLDFLFSSWNSDKVNKLKNNDFKEFVFHTFIRNFQDEERS